jgi:hypothetical protein
LSITVVLNLFWGLETEIISEVMKIWKLQKVYIEDFFHWNNKSSETESWHKIEAEYQKIIEKYCRPEFQPLGFSFGRNPDHHPDNEKIILVETVGNKSIVKTQYTLDYGFGTFVSDYEFHLFYENNRWYLEHIFYVTDEGRYECL